MRIAEIEIRACRSTTQALQGDEMRYSTIKQLDFLVIGLTTDEGLTGATFGFAASSAPAAARIAADAIRPFFLGKDPQFRERHWHEFRMADRWWNHVPIYSYGPFDIGCWILAAKAAGQPLYKYLGACRDRVPLYGSSLVLAHPEDYAQQALETKERGWAAYKLHPPGDERFDLAAYRLTREAVGEDFVLMSDPVASHTLPSALKMGRELERLAYHWFEEPLYDVDFHSLRKLSEALDIPVCGTEVLAGSHYSAAQAISAGCVDIVRSDVSWKGGITAVLKTAHLAEAFGMNCEIHTAIFHPLELVNLHCCAAIQNCQFFEVLLPTERFDFGLQEPILIEQGHAVLPGGPGLGIELDWDFIENSTLEVL